jgi:hypothetical protein
MTITRGIRRYRRSMTEDDMERGIADAVHRLGGYCWHVRDSRALNVEDMLDLLIIVPATVERPGIVALLETKSQFRQLTPGQGDVLDMLDGCSILISGVVRPDPKPGEMSYDDCLRALGARIT